MRIAPTVLAKHCELEMYVEQKGNTCPNWYHSRAAHHAAMINLLGEHELDSFCIMKRKTINHFQYWTV